MLRRKSKTQFVKQERNTQNGIALFNYLKHICAATINANNESFHQNIWSTKNATASLLNKKFLSQVILHFAGFESGPSDYLDQDITTAL